MKFLIFIFLNFSQGKKPTTDVAGLNVLVLAILVPGRINFFSKIDAFKTLSGGFGVPGKLEALLESELIGLDRYVKFH